MSRATDFASYLQNGDVSLTDLTPIELSTVGLITDAPGTGVGPWVRVGASGKPCCVHAELSDTTTPTATVLVEGSNTRSSKGAALIDTLLLSGAGAGATSVGFSGVVWVRTRLAAISGASAYATATLAR